MWLFIKSVEPFSDKYIIAYILLNSPYPFIAFSSEQKATSTFDFVVTVFVCYLVNEIGTHVSRLLVSTYNKGWKLELTEEIKIKNNYDSGMTHINQIFWNTYIQGDLDQLLNQIKWLFRKMFGPIKCHFHWLLYILNYMYWTGIPTIVICTWHGNTFWYRSRDIIKRGLKLHERRM